MRHQSILTLAILLFWVTTTRAQNAHPQNLVFEGAGLRGLAYTGALLALDSAHYLDSLQRVAGTSSGSIQACLLSVGYSASEIAMITLSTEVGKFNDGHGMFIGGSMRTINQFGWYRGNEIIHFLEDRIKEKTGDPHLTFKQLHDLRKQNPRFLDLYVTGTNLTTQRLVIFSFETFPNMRIADAVRVSTGIPLYYRPLWVDGAGSTYTGKKPPAGYMCMIDGGMASNFPLWIFDSTKYSTQKSVNSKSLYQFNERTLGIRVDKHDETMMQNGEAQMLPIGRISQFTGAMYIFMLSQLNQGMVNDSANRSRTINIDVGELNGKVRSVRPKVGRAMVSAGRVAAEGYIKERQ